MTRSLIACFVAVITAVLAILAVGASSGDGKRMAPAINAAAVETRTSHSRTRLGIAGTRFTVNGKPAFLLGISYYGALGASEDVVRGDLATMKRHGFHWLRVWAVCDFFNNDVSAVDGSGHGREPYLDRLKWLVARCDRLGLVVDVTLTRGSGSTPHLARLEDLRRAVETVVTELKPYRNWYLDLANERNVGDKRFVSFDELKDLRETTRHLDPDLLVTASDGGDIERDDLRQYLLTADVDFVCPHRPRDARSPAQTETKTKELLTWMKEISLTQSDRSGSDSDPSVRASPPASVTDANAGRTVPIHYQEPFRRGYTAWQPSAEDFAADLLGARAGGAAGWCFHNGGQRSAKDGRPRRSFDLRDGPLFKQLDAEELRFVEKILPKLHLAQRRGAAKNGAQSGGALPTPEE